MPLASKQPSFGSILGRRLFGGFARASSIERKLRSLPKETLKHVLKQHGVDHLNERRIAKFFAGEASLSSHDTARATKALRALGMVATDEGTGRLLMESKKRLDQDTNMRHSRLGISAPSLGVRIAEERARRDSAVERDPELKGKSIREIREILSRRLGLTAKRIVPRGGVLPKKNP